MYPKPYSIYLRGTIWVLGVGYVDGFRDRLSSQKHCVGLRPV